jgi:cysteine desulfurase / selenocysteine lyase
VGWLSIKEPFAFDYRLDLLPDARRFEPGSDNTIGICGLGGTLELIAELGNEAIEARVIGLTELLCEGLARKGYRIVSPRGARERSGIVIFDSERHPTEVLFERLTAARIVVSVRGGAIRVSPHYYNSEDEIAQLLATLH